MTREDLIFVVKRDFLQGKSISDDEVVDWTYRQLCEYELVKKLTKKAIDLADEKE